MTPSSERAAAVEETGLANRGPQVASDSPKNTGHLSAATVQGVLTRTVSTAFITVKK